MTNAKPIKYTVILEPADEGGYVVSCPALPGCISQGETLEETLENIKEAILLVIEVLQEEGEQIPNETPEIVTEEIREILKARAEEGLPLIIETHEVHLPSAVPV
jgi:predicted RNase H-like HicB family nuclease